MAKTALFSSFDGIADCEDSVISGVSVITEGEAKGHGVYIDEKTLQTVKACAETYTDGVKVKVNHGSAFDSIVGILRNFRIDGKKLLADLHLLKTHEMCEQICEMADEMPGAFGLSIAFSGNREEIDGKQYARCEELYSVDLVDDPAANPSGLFSIPVDSKKKGMTAELVAQFKEFLGFSKEITAPVIELESKLKAKDQELTAASAKVTELSAKVSELEAKHADEIKKLEASVEDRASKKAQELAAAQGIPAVKTEPKQEPAAPVKTELRGLAKVQVAIRTELAAQGFDEKKLSTSKK